MRDHSPENRFVLGEAPSGIVMTEEMGLYPNEQDLQDSLSVDESSLGTELLDENELKGILEALLHVSHDPVTLDKLTAVLDGPPKVVVNNALRGLQQDYEQDGRGLRIVEIAGGVLIVTRPDCAPWITRLQKSKPSPKVSRSAMETLAIVAYKQPIVRAEIEQIRGVETSGVLRTLLDHKLIRIVGRKDIPGRPIMYGTTKHFLQRFGLRDLRDLPPLREFKDLGESEDLSLYASNPLQENSESPSPEVAALDVEPDEGHGPTFQEGH